MISFMLRVFYLVIVRQERSMIGNLAISNFPCPFPTPLSPLPNPHSPKTVVDFNPFSGHYRQPLFPAAIINARINAPSKRWYGARESDADGHAHSTRRT